MSLPLIAIVGRPNVGKSMLFNRLAGRRIAIVEDTPGVTRDRLYTTCEWNGRAFTLVDTGGIEVRTENDILRSTREQAEIAIDTADAIVLVTDGTVGVTADDEDVANLLLRSKKPLILAVNKCDNPGKTAHIYEFYSLGLGDPYPVSAFHGHGTGDLLDACAAYFPEEESAEAAGGVHVAVIGKPNAGKSSLINHILGEERVIVSGIPGTTRDAIDSYFENTHGAYTFIDTAGLRKRAKVDERVEKFSVLRTAMAIERADVCLILIDAVDGVTEQDTKVAGLAHEAGKPSIIVVNKWDLVDKDSHTMKSAEKAIREGLAYMPYAPVIFISALTGQRVHKLFELINSAHASAGKRVTTGMLNQLLADATARVQPPSDRGKRLKILYMTQTGVYPPNFVVFCNDKELFHFSYQRYIENRIRDAFGFVGTPIRMVIKNRGES
ncbi:ribosome biogenesis GTPase Der [Oscillospiraceae bacterium OttesenSCG-928-F05]|nr:ribosome biogenesis GTPase Der [Oscillospiraceae bacterium OttesenSCG-928-F05]